MRKQVRRRALEGAVRAKAAEATESSRRLRIETAFPAARYEDEAETQTCAVCLEAMGGGEEHRRLSCGHCFHASCIDEWWVGGGGHDLTCPLCRKIVLSL